MGRVYDEAAAHREHLPGDLPRKAGATHLGMFFAWCALRDLASDWHGVFDPERLERLKRRELTGRDYVLQFLDGKLTDEHLTPAGQAFAEAWLATGRYFAAYTETLAADLPSPYHVADTWENLDRITPVLDAAFTDPTTPMLAGVAEPDGADVEPETDEASIDVLPPARPEEAAFPAEPLPAPEPLPEPTPLPVPDPLPTSDPLPEPELPREPEAEARPDLGIPHEDEAFAPYEEVLRTSGGPHGGPVIVTEPDDGLPPPVEEDIEEDVEEADDEAPWSWEETVRRMRVEGEAERAERQPPPLPREPEPMPRLARSRGPTKPKSKSGCLWVFVVIFMLIYGCTNAVSSAPRRAAEPPREEFRFDDEDTMPRHREAEGRER